MTLRVDAPPAAIVADPAPAAPGDREPAGQRRPAQPGRRPDHRVRADRGRRRSSSRSPTRDRASRPPNATRCSSGSPGAASPTTAAPASGSPSRSGSSSCTAARSRSSTRNPAVPAAASASACPPAPLHRGARLAMGRPRSVRARKPGSPRCCTGVALSAAAGSAQVPYKYDGWPRRPPGRPCAHVRVTAGRTATARGHGQVEVRRPSVQALRYRT